MPDRPTIGANDPTVDAAGAVIAADLIPLTGSEVVRVQDARGRILAGNVVSPINVPTYDNSAMDGYPTRWFSVAVMRDPRTGCAREAGLLGPGLLFSMASSRLHPTALPFSNVVRWIIARPLGTGGRSSALRLSATC
uniref:hypothetical protein n=1 Tax=Variovorax sp. BK018 TaxID=3450241 RepID=UPI00403A615E